MKGNRKVLSTLNALLSEELTAINQYMVHSEMCADWGYDRLHEKLEKRAIDEMKHAEKIIGRVLFLEGTPIVSKLGPIQIGSDIHKQFRNDLLAEEGAVAHYNRAIAETVAAADNGTREMLEAILADEEAHVDWLEAQLEQIEQMGLQIYLANQAKES